VLRLDEGFESEDISDILEETEQVTDDDELYEQDVEDIVDVLEKTKQKTKTQNDRKNFIRASSNIVSEKKKNVWKKIPVRCHLRQISFFVLRRKYTLSTCYVVKKSTITVFVFQSRNNLAKQIISGTDLNAKNYISQSPETGKVVSYSTPNIGVSGIRLPTVKPDDPEDISLLDAGGEGVVIPGDVTKQLNLAAVVRYSSVKEILSDEELKKSVDTTIGSTESLTIRSTIVSFTTEPQLNESVSNPFKILLQNNQVCLQSVIVSLIGPVFIAG
jgi:hypothetical protein